MKMSVQMVPGQIMNRNVKPHPSRLRTCSTAVTFNKDSTSQLVEQILLFETMQL